ncbi:MAG TPA: glycerol-3-phosphate acyltransferase, partial [Candidatus Saccharimonadales bacterium]|nr:glycerol-3-phosphate acyltransferase [Candidatus Saccharimonadales bacterium]
MRAYMAVVVMSYFVGSVPSGYLAGKARGIDVRTLGSGNIGATNAFRVLGKTAGTTVLLADALKGFVAARWLPLLV